VGGKLPDPRKTWSDRRARLRRALRPQDSGLSPPLQSIGGILRIYRVMRAVAAEAAEANQTLRLAQAGDQDAFAALVEQHEAMVFSIALRFFADRSRAEELAQEVFVQLYRSIGEIASDEHLLFWLRQVSWRRCIDQKRRFRLRAVSLDESHDREDTVAIRAVVEPRVMAQEFGDRSHHRHGLSFARN
jgi:hypothetical protein